MSSYQNFKLLYQEKQKDNMALGLKKCGKAPLVADRKSTRLNSSH